MEVCFSLDAPKRDVSSIRAYISYSARRYDYNAFCLPIGIFPELIIRFFISFRHKFYIKKNTFVRNSVGGKHKN